MYITFWFTDQEKSCEQDEVQPPQEKGQTTQKVWICDSYNRPFKTVASLSMKP